MAELHDQVELLGVFEAGEDFDDVPDSRGEGLPCISFHGKIPMVSGLKKKKSLENQSIDIVERKGNLERGGELTMLIWGFTEPKRWFNQQEWWCLINKTVIQTNLEATWWFPPGILSE